MEELDELQGVPTDALRGVDIRLPEEWVQSIMQQTDAERRAKRSPGRQQEKPEPLPEGFTETAAGILIHSLLKADKEKDIAAAVEGFLTAAEDITPQRARELYREHYT
jgi:hypothetical protein